MKSSFWSFLEPILYFKKAIWFEKFIAANQFEKKLQNKAFIISAQNSVYASYKFTFEFTLNISKIHLFASLLFISEKSKAKLWNVSWIKTLNHSSFLNTTISESFGHVVVNAVFTFISSSIKIFELGIRFSREVKYKYMFCSVLKYRQV